MNLVICKRFNANCSMHLIPSIELYLCITFYTSCSKYLISSISFCAHFSMHLNLCTYSMHLILCISSVRLNLCILFYAFYSIDIFYINLQELHIPFEAWKQTLKLVVDGPTDRPIDRPIDRRTDIDMYRAAIAAKKN